MNNKKIIITTIITAALFCSCSNKTNETSDITGTVTESSSEVSEITDVSESSAVSETHETADLGEPEGILKAAPENFPVIDGSTSAIALDAAIRAAYLGGFTAEELQPFVIHSTTQQSFQNLIDGMADAIFTVKVSEDQLNKAQMSNITLESVPAAKEAFVFIINEQNPVKSLTQEQLKDIFTGRISNWSEVGGNDAPIKVYLRNENSGSATYLRDFLGDEDTVSGERVFYSGSMGGITDLVASYDDGIDSIGISVYSYVEQIAFNEKKPAMIAVDGIHPDSSTLADDTYPLMSYTYFMYLGTQPEDSEVRKLAEFITTEEAQDAVESCGYVRAYN